MNFCGHCGQAFALLESTDRERRQVTVLFSDIVNFTRYTASINDDDVPEVLEVYQSIVKNAVFKQNGFIAQILGDGVMAYFGYPSALENATEHAIRAGLDIINDIKSMAGDKYDLKVRVGIHHGSGVITNVGGEGRLLVGNTPNVAARMQAIAESNTLVISEPTYQATRGLFEVAPLGHREVKGLSEPLEVFNVLNHKEVRRFDIDRQHDMGSLTGRQFELARLEEQFAITEKSNSFVLVSGDAGIGKSRLLYEFEHQIAGDSVWVTHRCSAYRSDSAFLPLRGLLNHTIGLSERQPDETRVEKIHHFLDSLSITDLDSKNILAEFLTPENTTSQKDYEQIETLLIKITRLATKDQRVIISLEDAHWVDQSTIDFLKRLFESQTDGGLMIIVTARPEFGIERLGKVPLEQISLGQLGEKELTQLIHEHLGNKVINAEVPQFIISKADGNPLFVEELTHTLVETGVITEINGQVQLDLTRSFQVPETLNDTLARRVDQLGAARYVAQVAAVIGREFDDELLTAVMDDQGHQIREHLDSLVATSTIDQISSIDGIHTYLFRHDLIRDAIYESMVRQQRETIHRNIAYTLETNFEGSVYSSSELLAQHWENAREPVLAIDYYREASNRLTEQAAHRESITYCRAALNLVRAQPQSLKRDRTELELLLTWGASMNSVDGYASPDKYTKVLEPALKLCERLKLKIESFPILYGIWSQQLGTADKLGTEKWKNRLVQTLSDHKHADDHMHLFSKFVVGTTAFWQANFDEAVTSYNQVIDDYNQSSHLQFMRVFGEDPGLYARLYLQWAHLFQGKIDLAESLAQETREFAAALKNPLAEVMTLAFDLHVTRDLGQVEETLEQANNLIRRAERDGYPYYFAIGFSYRNWALPRLGKQSETIASANVTVGDSFGLMGSAVLRDNAEVFLTEERFDEALNLINHAERVARGALDCLFLPDILRVKAEALNFSGRTEEATSAYLDALTTAENWGQKYWAVKAASSQFQHLGASIPSTAQTLSNALHEVKDLGSCLVYDEAKHLVARVS